MDETALNSDIGEYWLASWKQPFASRVGTTKITEDEPGAWELSITRITIGRSNLTPSQTGKAYGY